MLWNLLVTSFGVWLVSLIVFCMIFYVGYPRLISRLHKLPGKLMILKGLSSWWLVWPGLFAGITGLIYLTEQITFIEALCVIACLIMGERESQRILKVGLTNWADTQGYRIEGESAPEGS